jgi:hypothetical protein
MADKYQALINGRETLVEATVISTGVPQAGDIVGLDGTGRIDVSVLPVGVGPDVALITASEALASGDYVNIYNNAGVANVRKADASNDRPAMGFVKASVLISDPATIYFEGPNDAKTGLTIGSRYYLSTAGGATPTVPATPTAIISQFLGIAISATAINTDIEDAIVL